MNRAFRRKGPESFNPLPTPEKVDLPKVDSFQPPDPGLNASSPEASANKERERLFGREFSRRHRSATAALALEKAIWSNDDYDVRDLDGMIAALDAPKPLKKKLREFAPAFKEREAALDRLERQLCDLVGLRELAENPEAVCEAMHVTVTGKEPLGPISMQREPGSLLVWYEDPYDFALAQGENYTVDDNGQVATFTYGFFERNSGIELRQDGTIDHIRHSKQPRRKPERRVSERVPVIYVNLAETVAEATSDQDARDRVQSLIDHERSHFIYSLLGDSDDPYHEYKDELLARVREGADTRVSMSFFGQESYLDSFDPLSDRQQEVLDALIKDVARPLTAIYELYQTPDQRGVLTYQLYDTPFHEWPEYLTELHERTERLLSSIDAFLPPESDSIIAHLVQGIESELKTRENWVTQEERELVRLYHAWEDAYDHAHEALLTQSPTLAQIAVNNLEVISHHAKEAYS